MQQGCQMVFQTSETFWYIPTYNSHLVYFIAIRYIFVVFWYIFTRFGMLCQEKSGNPGMYIVEISIIHIITISLGHQIQSLYVFTLACKQSDQIGRIFTQ
jgi:hypothetical protein